MADVVENCDMPLIHKQLLMFTLYSHLKINVHDHLFSIPVFAVDWRRNYQVVFPEG